MKRALYPIIAMMVMFVTLGVGYIAGLVAVSDQPATTASPAAVSVEDLVSAKLWKGEYVNESAAAVAGWYRIGIVQRSANNSASVRILFDAGVLSDPSQPSATPVPSVSPSATVDVETITSTPTQAVTVSPGTSTLTPSLKPPTKTPSPSLTSTSTATDDAPPQETLDPNEPTPPDGPEKQCLTRNLSNGPFNIRADHVNDAVIVGQVPNAEYAAVDRIWIISEGEDEWFHVAHTRANGVVIRGWMHWMKTSGLEFPSADTDELCWELPIDNGSATYTPVPTQAGPTATPLPEIPFGCTVWNPGTDNINVRSGPGKTNGVLYMLKPGESGQAIHDYVSGADRWLYFSKMSQSGQNTYGWIALNLGSSTIAALRGDCSQLPRQTAIKVGWHTIQDFQWQWLASTATDYAIFKTTDLSKQYGPLYKSVNPSGLWVHRSVIGSGGAVNCPTWEWTSPQVWVERYRYTWPAGVDLVEIINECSTGPGGETFNNFVIESTRYANSLGFCVLIGSFASGTPDYPEWPNLVPILKFLDTNPCRYENGKPIYNGIALHGAFCSGPGMMSNEWTIETHICDRHMYIRNELLKATGYDLYNFKGPIVLSEIGTDGGYGGTSSDPTWPTDEWLKVVDYTLDLFEREGLVDAIILWNLGDGGAGQWISREYWIEPLAALLRSRALQ